MPRRIPWSESDLPYFDVDTLADLFVQARRKGDVQGAAAIMRTLAGKMFSALMSNARNKMQQGESDPESIASETILRAVQGALTSAKTFRGTTRNEVFAYVYQIQRNVINDYRDKESRRRGIAFTVSLDNKVDDDGAASSWDHPDDEDGYIETVAEDFIDHVMATFNPTHRQIIHLRYIAGYPSKDTARLTNTTANNVDQVMRRFKKALAAAWADSEDPGGTDGDTGHNGDEDS
ncbi:MAG: RNA polymerase sigma factor [Solirubrobacterales bacterium]|nr:RNA polymerase sigma factor [Solirubrobacterales bacterium]